MAIIIPNRSICRICGNIIREGEEIAGFPHFASTEKDPLSFFSDAGFHVPCFLAHPLREEVMKAVAEWDIRRLKTMAGFNASHLR